jgi:hypothetical protein
MKGVAPSKNTHIACSLKLAKTYVLVSPNQQTIQITNLKQFCIANELSYISMWKVARGRRVSYKGWGKTIWEKF